MSRFALLSLALLLTAPAAAQLSDAPAGDPANSETVIDFGAPEALSVVTGDGVLEFSVLLADEDDERARGLMFRSELGDSEGMLFDYGQPQQVSMWMRNTEIPLDIIYVDSDGEILKIFANAQPYSLRTLPSEFPVLAALEVRGGLSREAGIRPGDTVRHRIFGNADAMADEEMVEAETVDDSAEGDSGGEE
ncbi:DUF192 domain-containing protein [Hyphobacterium marinum]|uniref:DUF192 domain-containing protein n=1 Tax=Hyphobacterium marinum TaxID=3116574 RepID=A0ABU7LYL4_9PROT|nr:DUF192 domain-containing protein [Hyphobacterium sp. Y6023]MEE2566646.1 DUF192 domain-containing protein [Hyphobacterium sp. Y6023]